MKNASNSAQILDFNRYRETRAARLSPVESSPPPVYVWYPVWLLVPQSPFMV